MKKIIITGAITLGILGICGYTAFAATENQNNNTAIKTQQQYCNLNHNNKHNGQYKNNGQHHNTDNNIYCH